MTQLKKTEGERKEKEVTGTTRESKHEITSPSLSFEINDLHQKALLKLLHCHHNVQTLTYPELSAEIGIGEKTKRWQCEAWKDLKGNGFIVPEANGKKTFKLSEKGLDLAMTFASDEELADFKTPATNEEHHEKIRSKLMRQDKAKKYGPKIFDLLLEARDTPMTRLQLSTKFNTNPDSHAFFYGFKALQKMGLVCTAKVSSKSKGEDAADIAVDNKKETPEEAMVDSESLKDRPKKRARIRGGKEHFKLSEKAFLATARKEEEKETFAKPELKMEG